MTVANVDCDGGLCLTCDMCRSDRQFTMSISELQPVESRWTRQQGGRSVPVLCRHIRTQVGYDLRSQKSFLANLNNVNLRTYQFSIGGGQI